jgi:RND family efflux transporter MFP subunit
MEARMKNLLRCSVILVATVFSGCARDEPAVSPSAEASAPPNGSSSRPILVEVFEVKPSALPSYQLIPAVVSVEGTALVLAARDGTVVQLKTHEGASVSKGQIVAQLNDDDLRAAVRQAELEVERLLVEERQYVAMISVNRSEFEQETSLYKEGLTSKRQVDRAQYKVEVAKEELERTRLATSVARAKVEASKADLERCVVRSPINGIVARRFVHLGTGVAKNDKLFEISQRGPFEVKFQLPQTEKGRLRPGSVVDLSLADNNQVVARARIRRVDTVADAASNTVGFLADVLGRTSLMTGLAVNVHLPNAETASSVWIPRSAFPAISDLRSGSAATLFVLNGERCELRTVLVQKVDRDQVEISSGLSIGERIILAPPAELKAGDGVQVKS